MTKPDGGMPLRVAVLLVCFVLAGYVVHSSGSVQPVPIRKPLSLFPERLGEWQTVRVIPSRDDVVRMLGVTDYINYIYKNKAGMSLDFYVGYYHAVGVDGAYHSPKNCLPGGGWGIASEKDVLIKTRKGRIAIVSEMVIQKGESRQVVLYWYQNRGRIIASEYAEKIYLVVDALLKHRRDGAFVRIMAHSPKNKIEDTEEEVKRFAGLALETLTQFLPGREL